MAQGNDNRNGVVYSQSLTEETTNTQRQRFATGTLAYQPPELPTLPFDLLPEILCRLPVKLLIQLRCLCKFFDSLISDPNFAKKHLHMSTKRHHLMLTELDMLTNDDDDDDDYYSHELVMHESPISSLFSTSTVVTLTQLYLPGHHVMDVLCCCDGMICGKLKNGSYFLWNPSIRKFKLLPPLENHDCWTSLSFGYDHFVNNYKVVAVSVTKEVCVHTLGTDYWKRIEDIPYYGYCGDGVFVSGTVNWLTRDVILSLNLEKESYRMVSLPDYENQNVQWTMGVVRDCLSVFARRNMCLDVWIGKDYGNIGTWTKLYNIPHLHDRGLKAFTALYISEDDQLLVKYYDLEVEREVTLVVYDTKTGTSIIPHFQNNYEHIFAKVYIESLVSP